jgi:hypothetical protein
MNTSDYILLTEMSVTTKDLSSGVQYHVVQCKSTRVLEKYITSNFGVEELTKQVTSIQHAICFMLISCLGYSDTEDGSNTTSEILVDPHRTIQHYIKADKTPCSHM